MKKILLITSFLSIIILVLVSNQTSTNAYSALPPDAHAGAPMDNGGQNCTGCHIGTATQTTGVISSDIPGSGFVGNTTYNFTVTMSGAAAYGFEITPQTATSNAGIGTLIAGTGTGLSTKYVKHSAKKLGATASWSFQWTAPANATTVTFYGAFIYSNNNSTSSGDIVKTSSVTYLANTTGINEIASKSLLSVYPNPTTNFLHINSNELFTKGSIFTLDGKLQKNLSENELSLKTVFVSNLSNGTYYISMSSDEKNLIAKFIKND